MIRHYHSSVQDSHTVVQHTHGVYSRIMCPLLPILYDVFWMVTLLIGGALVEGIATGIACAWLGKAETFGDDC